jgi:cobalt-zinc-cadmium efflux system protein
MPLSVPETDRPCSHGHRPIGLDAGHHAASRPHAHHEGGLHRPQQRRALLLSMLLTAAMMVVEFAAGLFTGSLMLISDAIHMLSHAAALGISLLAVVLAHKRTGEVFPFGLYRIEILAALFNGIGLAGFSAWIVYEGVLRIIHPVPVLGPELTAVALVGLAVNLVTAAILQRAGVDDLNTRSAFMHMLADSISSVAIVAGGVVILFTGWLIVDPLLSILVALLVARWSWNLLRDSVLILLERVPAGLDVGALQTKVKQEFKEVQDIHDVHAWEITSQFTCLTMHVVLEDMPLKKANGLRARISRYVRDEFSIAHSVIQLE